MQGLQAVSEYTGLDILRVLELPCDMYALCHKNWMVGKLRQTEEGREYLKDCERYKHTKMDFAALDKLRAMMGG